MANNGIKLCPPLMGDYPITQNFGDNQYDYSQFGLPSHNGTDFGCPTNTPVYAMFAGTVGKLGFDPVGYGNYVRLNHSWGRTIYAHLTQYLVTLGQPIKAGEILGRSGSTGYSSGPHLHAEMRLNGLESNGYNGAVDLVPYLNGTISPIPPEDAVVPIVEPVEPIVAADYGIARVLSDNLNVRDMPSVDGALLGMLPRDFVFAWLNQKTMFDGSVWLEIGNGIYCASVYDGEKLVELAV